MASQDIPAMHTARNDSAGIHQVVQNQTTDNLNTASPSYMHEMQNVPPRTNFPLPPELRNHIYSYLLDVEYTRVDRCRVGDRAYRFHTNILGVNREIHYEAEEYLYKRNVFVVVSHQFSRGDFKAMISMAPYVAELQQIEFKYHLLSVHLSEVPYRHSQRSNILKSTWLFLSVDLEQYRLFASLFLADRIKCAPQLTLKNNGSLSDHFLNSKGRQRNSDHLRLKFCRHRYRKATSELQGSLLASLRLLDCPSLLVTIRGDVLDHESARDLEYSMGPNLLCSSAINWHFLKIWDGFQATIDASMIQDEPKIAAHIYEETLKMVEGRRRTRLSRSYDIRRALVKLSTGLAYGKVYIQWAMQDTTEFAKAVSGLLEMHEPYTHTKEGTSWLFELHMLALVVSPPEATLPPFPRITIAECIVRLCTSRLLRPLYDAAILKKCPDQNKIFTPDDLPAASCSFLAKPMSGTGFGQIVKKPDHIKGFLDLNLLRKFNKGTKEQINKLQAERGWCVTRFEECDEVDIQSNAA